MQGAVYNLSACLSAFMKEKEQENLCQGAMFFGEPDAANQWSGITCPEQKPLLLVFQFVLDVQDNPLDYIFTLYNC